MNKQPIRLILCDIRSAHNVGAILRTADATGIELVYTCGYTPHPGHIDDSRPAHVIHSNTRALSKTALGAEGTVQMQHFADTASAISEAHSNGFKIIVLEQSEKSLNLFEYHPKAPIALVLGNEVTGISPQIQSLADIVLELPMLGRKESLNVAVATGIALYQLRFGTHAG
jgi:tRNA G18 (ribose-2'-O)-methylase SpoU